LISPPIRFLNPAAMSRPTCLARIVLPLTMPRILETCLPGISAVVVVIISFILLYYFLGFKSFLCSSLSSSFRRIIIATPTAIIIAG